MVQETKLTSEISCPTDSYLAQLVEHYSNDQEVMDSKPTGGNFWRIFFSSSLCKYLSDNLTETSIMKNAIVQWSVVDLGGVGDVLPWPNFSFIFVQFSRKNCQIVVDTAKNPLSATGGAN